MLGLVGALKVCISMWQWDEVKRQQTILQRGLDFVDVVRLDVTDAVIEPDLRRNYGEALYRVTAPSTGSCFQ